MRLVEMLSRSSGANPMLGYTRLSSLLPSMGPGDPLPVGSGAKLFVDVEMEDADYLGQFDVAPGALLVFDPSRNTRLLCQGFRNWGTTVAAGNRDDVIASRLVATTPHPTRVTIDLCGPAPTVNGFSPAQRTALGIDSSLQRGFTHYFNTPLGNDGFLNDFQGVSRGFINEAGGRLLLHGADMPTYRRLNSHYASGTTLVLDAPITAKAGDRVLVSPTGFFNDATRTEERTLAADVTNSTTITINTALGYARWGKLIYATDTDVQGSLTAGTFSTMRNHAGQVPEIDERAFVCVMERRIRIRGYDAGGSTSLASDGFGVHGMTMSLTGQTVLKNMMLEDYGQAGLLARYGWHFHQPSYNADGTYRTDGAESPSRPGKFANYPAGMAVLDNVTFWKGHNRALTYHACRGAVADWCIGYKSRGHTFFEEEGSEEDNAWRNCVALRADAPDSGMVLKVHDTHAEINGNPVGFWMANPNNEHIDCWAVDCKGMGWWNAWSGGLGAGTSPSAAAAIAYGSGCLGFSSKVPIYPFWGIMGTWRGMSSLSCFHGGMTDAPPYDNMGNTGFGGFTLTIDGMPSDEWDGARVDSEGFRLDDSGARGTQKRALIEGFRLYKCGQPLETGFCYRNRISLVEYRGPRTADNYGPHFQGQTHIHSLLNHPISIRETLNHEAHALNAYFSEFAASYHGLLDFNDFTMYGFGGGSVVVTNTNRLQKNSIMETWDLYANALQAFSLATTPWKMLGCAGVYQTPGPCLLNDFTVWDTEAGGHIYEDNPAPVGGVLSAGSHFRWQLGILYDHYGNYSTGPTTAGVAHSHIVPNLPFYALGTASPTALEECHGSVVTTTPFFGLWITADDDKHGEYSWGDDATFVRLDATRTPIAGATIQMRPSRFNLTNPAAADQGSFFWGNHHAAAPSGAIVRVKHIGYPSALPPNVSQFAIDIPNVPPAFNTNASNNDYIVIGIPWSGSVPPRVAAVLSGDGGGISNVTDWYNDDWVLDNTGPRAKLYTSFAGTFAAFLASSMSTWVWWHDTANNELFVKVHRFGTGNHFCDRIYVRAA